jgi:hypothetical protein
MRILVFALFAAGLLLSAGCDDKGAAQGSGTGTYAQGRVKVGVPF